MIDILRTGSAKDPAVKDLHFLHKHVTFYHTFTGTCKCLLTLKHTCECSALFPEGLYLADAASEANFSASKMKSQSHSTTYKCKTLIFPIPSCTNRLLIIDPMRAAGGILMLISLCGRLRLPDQTRRREFFVLINKCAIV